jgi:ribosomal protein S18 acetylase RimI-like enzyme
VRAPLRIAPLARSHRARVEEIVRATGAFSDAEVAVAVELFDEAYGAADSSYVFVGAFAPDGALQGYACHGPTPATDGTHDLYWIAVDPAAQGGGAGSALLAEVERRVRAARGRLVVIETSGRADYAATRAFYLARGYAEAARVRDFYAPADDRIVFTKRVAPLPGAPISAAAGVASHAAAGTGGGPR